MYSWTRFYFRLPIFLRLFLTVIVFMVFFGALIHFIEPQHFPTIFDGIWWAFVTGSTVGYGDYVPLSNAGRIIGILLILAGGGLVTFYMATLSAGTIKHEKDLSTGKVAFKGKGHIILVGWNERTRQLIEIMQQHNDPEDIVLIDRTMRELPYNQYPVHFIRGDVSDDETLHKANISYAKEILITADPSMREEQADQVVILAIVAMKGLNPELKIIAEILTEKHSVNARRAGATTVIRSNDFMSALFYHELHRNDPVKPFELLLEIMTEQQFHELDPPDTLVGKQFKEALIHYASDKETLVGIIRDEQLKLNLYSDAIIEKSDRLVVLTPLSQ
ncbi:potassium channel family protein [Thalassobacillus hwangdonensis]|uniref:Potassium channel family protein n=1 Tax=Thalassobacillus hwangdonensis TaxID=546108 RepID=A0ABW3L513_9BACI